MLAVLGVGPKAPATKRGLSGVLNLSQAARASSGGFEVHLARQVGHLVVLLRDGGGAEGVGLDQVGTGREVALVDVADHVGAREREQFVVALHVALEVLEALAAVLLLGELEALDHRAHGPVEDGDALCKDAGQGLAAGVDDGLHSPRL
jgi:hypothetical protein